MKGILPRLTAFLIITIMAVSCQKNSAIEKPEKPSKKTQLAQITNDFGKIEVTYNEDGSVKETMLSNLRGYLEKGTFSYEGNKLQTIWLNGVVFKYSYDNNRVSSIEVSPEPGNLTERYDYVYNNNFLTERIKLVKINNSAQLVPYSKIKYTFSTAGNVIKSQAFSWAFGGWNSAGEVITYEYDNKENTLSRFEAEPFLPENLLMKNNPVKVVHSTAFGETTKTVTHSYTYNEYQQPVSRQTVVSAVNYGGTTTNYTVSYGK